MAIEVCGICNTKYMATDLEGWAKIILKLPWLCSKKCVDIYIKNNQGGSFKMPHSLIQEGPCDRPVAVEWKQNRFIYKVKFVGPKPSGAVQATSGGFVERGVNPVEIIGERDAVAEFLYGEDKLESNEILIAVYPNHLMTGCV